jgi:hypothetical protein
LYTSTIRSVVADVYKHTSPEALSGVMTRFGTV